MRGRQRAESGNPQSIKAAESETVVGYQSLCYCEHGASGLKLRGACRLGVKAVDGMDGQMRRWQWAACGVNQLRALCDQMYPTLIIWWGFGDKNLWWYLLAFVWISGVSRERAGKSAFRSGWTPAARPRQNACESPQSITLSACSSGGKRRKFRCKQAGHPPKVRNAHSLSRFHRPERFLQRHCRSLQPTPSSGG
jgi:hypothetical protein